MLMMFVWKMIENFRDSMLCYVLEMGQMSDCDIRLKPKVWVDSLNEC